MRFSSVLSIHDGMTESAILAYDVQRLATDGMLPDLQPDFGWYAV